MRNMIGNTIRIAAATTAFAVGAPTIAYAETAPTGTEVDQTLQHDYNQLTSSAEHFGYGHGVNPNSIGSVGLKVNRVVFGEGETGNVIEIQSDAYNKTTRELNEYVIDVYAPDSQTVSSTTVPNSLFQITLFKGKNDREKAPKTPAGFSKAINRAAGKSALTEYNFYFGVIPGDASWQVAATHSGDPVEQVFSTAASGPLSAPRFSASENFGAVRKLIAQGQQVLNAAEKHRVMPKGTPADLRPRHPQ